MLIRENMIFHGCSRSISASPAALWGPVSWMLHLPAGFLTGDRKCPLWSPVLQQEKEINLPTDSLEWWRGRWRQLPAPGSLGPGYMTLMEISDGQQHNSLMSKIRMYPNSVRWILANTLRSATVLLHKLLTLSVPQLILLLNQDKIPLLTITTGKQYSRKISRY